MAINPTMKITAKSGTVKVLAAKDLKGDMGSDAAWYSSLASTVSSLPHTLSNTSLDWVIWERGNYAAVEFTPDSAGSDGQGFIGPSNSLEVTVDAVSGTVYIVRGIYVSMADTKALAFNNTNRVAASVGDKLRAGDLILAAKSGATFKIKMTSPSDIPGAYASTGIVQIGLLN